MTIGGTNTSKKVEKRLKKCFNQFLGAASTQKQVEIHNTYGFCFFSPMVIFIFLFGHLVFYLFNPLDLVYWTSSPIPTNF